MDIGTILGLVGAVAVIVILIMIDGGNFAQYYDKHAVIVIFGGAFAATLLRYPLGVVMHGIPMGFKAALGMRSISPRQLVEEIANIADVARKQGPTALEKLTISDPVLAQGVRYIADGYDADFIRQTMETDKDKVYAELDEAQKIYRSIGDCAPAFGMIGTLLGMVNMFANMTDPSKLGPIMAMALIATLYGAVVANMVCMPIADKCHLKMAEEDICRSIIIDGVIQIRNQKSPQVVKEMLLAYLNEHDRHELAEAA
ncbi:motility protein A [Phreatobacter oligotrophus]|jgi:chemotaxis protein MotA|uniref:Chemotaxis protein MotA n=1 Tax=Phreatobacter oligotrophus TaxID=1122261 RepID=A0A2T4Z5G1_9HYPH|nr:MotA/TolQ/ExbB proton channel family protein [Phreatobacter oligotrophus]MBX9989898.1 MotA/TolQ/ExbB proton channel family protein [Phreatobacter oligotrophus]PTM57137.1 chemotaxis protein MotA [Phreatobacter oligotrophus]